MCLLFCGTRDQTQGFVFARRALCHREGVCVSLPMHQTLVILGLQTSVSTEETAHQKSFICFFQSYVLIPLGAHKSIYAHIHMISKTSVTMVFLSLLAGAGLNRKATTSRHEAWYLLGPCHQHPHVPHGPSLARVSTLWKLVGELTRLGCKNMSSGIRNNKRDKIAFFFFETFICRRARNIKAHSVILPWASLLSVLGGGWGCIRSD